MINAEEFKTKVDAFIGAYTQLREYLDDDECNETIVSAALDDDYKLVIMTATIIGEIIAIVDNDYQPLFYYTADDEWTVGDILGGYLDLFFKQ